MNNLDSRVLDNRKIAMYLAGKLPPYYGSSNTYSFSRKVRALLPQVFTTKELTYCFDLAKDDETYYYYILTDLFDSHSSVYMKLLISLNLPKDFYQIN